MKFQALGGAREVGGSSYLLEIDGKSILFDAGIRLSPFPGQSPLPKLDLLEKLDLIVLTHAHLDHIGSLPVVTRMFPKTWVLCTVGTFDLAKILLSNNLQVLENRAVQEGKEKELLYTERELNDLPNRIFLASFRKWFRPFPDCNIRMCFHPAGHILGAASILIEAEEGKVIVTGDFSLIPQYTIAGAPSSGFKADLVISEGTYGGELHPSREEEQQAILEEMREVITNQGVALIPSFAVGRAQEMALMILEFQEKGLLPDFPVYIDGLVQRVCDVYEERLGSLFSHKSIKWVTRATREFNIAGPACVIASSGNLKGGFSVEYAKHIVGRKNSAIFFPGYQDAEAPGRRLLELKSGDEIKLGKDKFLVDCTIKRYKFSAHADRNGLKDFIKKCDPKVVILIHGEFKAIYNLASRLKGMVVWAPGNRLYFDPFEKKLEPFFDKRNVQDRRVKGGRKNETKRKSR